MQYTATPSAGNLLTPPPPGGRQRTGQSGANAYLHLELEGVGFGELGLYKLELRKCRGFSNCLG